jgi:hypothetical protein
VKKNKDERGKEENKKKDKSEGKRKKNEEKYRNKNTVEGKRIGKGQGSEGRQENKKRI